MHLQPIHKTILILILCTGIAAAIVTQTFKYTQNPIAAAERDAAQRALIEIVPHGLHDNDIVKDFIVIPAEKAKGLGSKVPVKIFTATQNYQLVAFIVPITSPNGYGGDIKMVVGINADGTIAGVRILSHKETPGLGDKIDFNKSRWILNFDGKSLSNPKPSLWKIKKDDGDFDQIAGATITSRAVVAQVRDALVFIEHNRESLLQKMNAGQQK